MHYLHYLYPHLIKTCKIFCIPTKNHQIATTKTLHIKLTNFPSCYSFPSSEANQFYYLSIIWSEFRVIWGRQLFINLVLWPWAVTLLTFLDQLTASNIDIHSILKRKRVILAAFAIPAMFSIFHNLDPNVDDRPVFSFSSFGEQIFQFNNLRSSDGSPIAQ